MKNNELNLPLIEKATHLLQKGDQEQALDICKKILNKDPESFEANHIAGIVSLQKGFFEVALDFFDKALVEGGTHAVVWSNRSLALSGLKRFDEAMSSVNKSLKLDPNFADAFYNKAVIFIKLDCINEAIDNLNKFINQKPNHALAIFLKADLLRKLEKNDLAIDALKEALRIKPNYLEAMFNLGQLLSDSERYEESILYFDKLIELNPKIPEVFSNKGVTLERMGKFQDAKKYFEEALKLQPDHKLTIQNYGIVFEKLGQLESAITQHNKLISMDKSDAVAYFNRACCYERLQKLDQAIEDYSRSIELDPNKTDAQWNRSLTLLCKGDYEKGWFEYEKRLRLGQAKNFYLPSSYDQFKWNGDKELILGKRLMVRAEQGLGDTIQFCRYVKQLSQLGAIVILRVQKPLMNILRCLEGVSELSNEEGSYPEFDYYCNLMSLPFLLRTSIHSIPNEIPYLKADVDKVKVWADRLGPKVNKRVGLVWSGGFRPDRPDLWLLNRRRNIELIQLFGLKTEGIEFHSLQKGELPEAELVVQHLQNWDGPKIINHAYQLTDFTETAALIENLDLLISVDTSTPHLAGALGKPVWLMNRFDTCWRWFLHRSDSPWYPTFRIFRQKSYDDWIPVIEEVKTALDEFAKT